MEGKGKIGKHRRERGGKIQMGEGTEQNDRENRIAPGGDSALWQQLPMASPKTSIAWEEFLNASVLGSESNILSSSKSSYWA